MQLSRLISALAAFALVAGAEPALAKKPEIQTDLLSNLAVDGYDAVAFFVEGKPVKGSANFSTDYKGAVWRFSSAENLARFTADPTAYAPQYGGYCAWAVAQGYTAPGDPRYWTIVAGKLYLNFDAKVQSDWQKDIPGFIAKADANWPGVLE
jgi:YHS domain-containing protein